MLVRRPVPLHERLKNVVNNAIEKEGEIKSGARNNVGNSTFAFIVMLLQICLDE